MPKLSDLPAVRKCCEKIAEHMIANWRTLYENRKDDQYFKTMVGFDAETENEAAVLAPLWVEWSVFESGITQEDLAEVIFQSLTSKESEGEITPRGRLH